MGIAHRVELLDFCRSRICKTAAEIGVLDGRFSALMLERLPDAVVHSVDPWRTTDGGVMLRELLAAVNRLTPYGDRSVVWPMPSLVAADLFADHHFDLVYVDGDHRYESVLADLKAWYPKVKPDGVLAGDDWGERLDGGAGLSKQQVTPRCPDRGVRGVMRAVREFAEDRGLQLQLTTRETKRICRQWYFVLGKR